jgi:alpha,alpha-trehalase
MSAYDQLPKDADGLPSNATLQSFLGQYFGMAGTDFNYVEPPGFTANPSQATFLPNVTNTTIRTWAVQVNDLWQDLTAEVNSTVEENSERHTLIALPYVTAVPGDRFREVYYWDSYWVIKGLLVSGLTEVATGQVLDLVSMLEQYGHVPNGARKYYINRSQPPLLSQMVGIVYNATNNTDLLRTSLMPLISEHEYWTSPPKDVVVAGPNGQEFGLSRYYANWTMPRPESYAADLKTAANFSAAQKEEVYLNLASGAESGWDFSSKWFVDPADISTIRTTMVIPVELNAYLYQMENDIARFATILGNTSIATEFQGYAANRKEAINTLMYNATAGHWNDLIIQDDTVMPVAATQRPAGIQYVTNYVPLWVGIADAGSEQAANVTQSFFNSGLINSAGISTSTFNSTQQWDYPNSWPPMHWIMVQALNTYGGAQGQQVAASQAQVYLQSMYAGFQQSGHMIEKYNAVAPGLAGYGGEYTTQVGFGWTNGVMLDFLQQFGWNPAAANTTVQTVGTTPQQAATAPNAGVSSS